MADPQDPNTTANLLSITPGAPRKGDAPPLKKSKRSRKKARIEKLGPTGDEVSQVGPCHITKLPIELIAEILMLTNSPKDVLAVARCSKFFCATLVRPENDFIWRYARDNCKPYALPKPISTFTESSYAAYIFDGGICEICKSQTSLFYSSFALKLRLCHKWDCMKAAPRLTISPAALARIQINVEHGWLIHGLPQIESEICINNDGCRSTLWPKLADSKNACRRSDWNALHEEYLEASKNEGQLVTFMKKFTLEKTLITERMKLAVALHKWKLENRKMARETKKANETFSKALAIKEGVEYWDLMESRTYGPLHRLRNKTLERVEQVDYDVNRPAIEAELLKMKEARKRRAAEATYRESRAQVEKQYNRLRSSASEGPLPPLQSFRELSVLKLFQSPTTPVLNVAKELRSPVIQTLLTSNLDSWRQQVKQSLGALLGHPNWAAASTNKLHPVDRITARFQCQRCKWLGVRYESDGCFDFAGACSHQCSSPQIKSLPKEWKTWDAKNFVRDEKAIAAMSKVLAACSLDAEDPNSIKDLEAIGARIQCLSCQKALVMDPASVIGHSHRHEEMQLSLLSKADADKILQGAPFVSGLGPRLMGPESRAKVLQTLKNYGCRHCTPPKVAATSAAPSRKALFIFNGLRSHLKSKHSIERLRDEDFFCEETLVWDVVQGGDDAVSL